MTGYSKLVLSASRRTDIPAFYMPWFMGAVERGFFEVRNPYNRRVSVVPASADRIGAIVFWSKNFGPFIENDWGTRLVAQGYRLYFNFTINSPQPLLEPAVPPLADRLEQLAKLSRQYGPAAIAWRLDPICLMRTARGDVVTNLDHVDQIRDAAADAGITRCVTSFVDLYAKVKRRAGTDGRIRFIEPAPADKRALLLELERTMTARHIQLETCCEKDVIDALPSESTVRSGACISNRRLMSIYGGCLSTRRDRGQRIKHGCRCQVSVDIGSYDLHPCYHNCLFCYANPRAPETLKDNG